MRLYEFEGKELFKKFKIPVPVGRVAGSIKEVYEAVASMKESVALKSQVLTGGRGKAGGIKLADGPNEARTLAGELLEMKIKGFPVERLLIEPKLDIKQEFYIGVTIDRANYKLVVIASGEGGVDIEETAEKNPDKIVRKSVAINEELYSFDTLAIAKKIGIPGELLRQASGIIRNLFRMFKTYDAKLVEINPLVLTSSGELLAADSRVSLDDDATFRHPDLRGMGIEKRHEEGAMTPRELQATDWGIPSSNMRTPSSHMLPVMRITIGLERPCSFKNMITPLAKSSQRLMPPNRAPKITLTFGFSSSSTSIFAIRSGDGPPPESIKLAGLPPKW